MENSNSSFRQWLSGSIRRKLTFFVVLMCLMIVSLFWTLSVFMLQPSYNNLIRNDLSATLNTVVAVLNKADADGIVLHSTGTAEGTTNNLSEEVIALLAVAQQNGQLSLDIRCLDISDSQMSNLFLYDGLAPRCLLHQSHEAGITDAGVLLSPPERNGALVALLRAQIVENGSYFSNLEGGQMVMGATAANGKLVVVLSANLERIPQAVNVLKRMLVPLSFALVLFSTTFAWVFSLWFTRPLNRLSCAARQVAKGNYEVSLFPIGEDEIATLTRDFNTMTAEVKRSTEMQKELIANVSHDLRTPLTLIKGYAETVRDLTGDDKAKRTEQLSVIVDETDRLSALVNSVMEFSRMSTGAEKPHFIQFNLYQLCDEVGYRYQVYCQQKGYIFDFSGDENCNVLADPALIERALHNLMGNALNHVGSDGYIGLHLQKTLQNKIRVEVVDHGAGIDPKDIPYLFDRYFRSRQDSGKKGTGLGLSIVKAIFSAHNFAFGVQSEVGKGSTFWFEAAYVPPKKGLSTPLFHPKRPKQ